MVLGNVEATNKCCPSSLQLGSVSVCHDVCLRVVSRLCSVHPYRPRVWHFQTGVVSG